VEYRWPGTTWRHSFTDFHEEEVLVELGDAEAVTRAV
jgi:hypothetical protein